MSHTIRCPVCDGSGAVEAWFGTGCLPENMKGLKEKQCPACYGDGTQTVLDPGDWEPKQTKIIRSGLGSSGTWTE